MRFGDPHFDRMMAAKGPAGIIGEITYCGRPVIVRMFNSAAVLMMSQHAALFGLDVLHARMEAAA